MDYNVNVPGGEGLQQVPVLQYRYQGYPPVYKRPWFWAVVAAVLICTAVVTVLLASGGQPGRHELTGNAGVAAVYDFFCSRQDSQDRLAGPFFKELGERLKNEPFEAEGTVSVGMDSLINSFLPIGNVTIGVSAKYDLKDFGIRLGSMGTEISGYLIGDNIVVSFMGSAGSVPIEPAEGINIEKNMGLEERIKALLPFLPEDEICFALLDKFAHAVPDKYTAEDSARIYSPKDDKEVRMDVITTTLDSRGLKEVVLGFADGIKSDKKLNRQLQDMIDKFTGFAGLEPQDLDGLIEGFEGAADSEDLKDIEVSWSVYQRHGNYVGISFEILAEDTEVKYTYMCEFDGNDSYESTTSDVNGIRSEAVYEYNWQGGKLEINGELKTIVSEGTGNTAQLIGGVIEFSKNGGNEYDLTGDITIEGDVYNDILNSQGGESYDMKIDATVRLGGGLGTLKEDRDWNGIYEKEWGSMEDVFGWLFPDDSYFFDYDIGNNL